MTPLEQIEFVANKFRKLPCDFAFLGGAVLGVLITDPAAPPARTTKDVDVLVNTPTRKSYTDLEAQLRKLGFKNDTTEGAPNMARTPCYTVEYRQGAEDGRTPGRTFRPLHRHPRRQVGVA